MYSLRKGVKNAPQEPYYARQARLNGAHRFNHQRTEHQPYSLFAFAIDSERNVDRNDYFSNGYRHLLRQHETQCQTQQQLTREDKHYELFPTSPLSQRHHILCPTLASERGTAKDKLSGSFQCANWSDCIAPTGSQASYPDPNARYSNAHRQVQVDLGNGLEMIVATAETRGRRPTMEDAFIEYSSADNMVHVFGVCDGHGGSAVSGWLKNNLGPIIERQLRNGDTLQVAFKVAQATMERELASQEVNEQGSTACVAVLFPKNNAFFVANCGDSRALLLKYKQTGRTGDVSSAISVQRITRDHKPSDPDEKIRIEKKGGSIRRGDGVARVSGILAVSRSFGDGTLRSDGLTEMPDVFGPFSLHAANEKSPHRVVLACDGLFDVVSDERVALTASQVAANCLASTEVNVARQLRNLAFASNSSDNISVMILSTRNNLSPHNML